MPKGKPSKGKKYIHGDSENNKAIKEAFIAGEVYVCVSQEIDAVLTLTSRVPLAQDEVLPRITDIENLAYYECPQCKKDAKPAGNHGKPAYVCENCGWEGQDTPKYETREVYEWWIVSAKLAGKLQGQGEPVMFWGANCYWGRTTDKPMVEDRVITTICKQMKLLK